jgi:hypothetical protein
MNELDNKPQPTSFSISTATLSGPRPVRRLIVLVPADANYTAATRRVWELAVATDTRVLLLGLCKDAAQEPSLRRQLVTMSALVGNGKVSTEAKVEIGTNWVQVVKRNYHTGDVIVCFAEQRAGLMHKPLSQILESNLNATVYILSGLYQPDRLRSNWLSTIILWSGFFGIIGGFLLLQVNIDPVSKDWVHTAALMLSIPVEFWLIWVWNSLFG